MQLVPLNDQENQGHYSSFFMRSIVFFLLLPISSYAQVIFNGKVVENFTGNAIPYATIGLVKQNVGTNANEKGEFIIASKQPDIDTLIISCIGYTTVRLPVKELKANPTVSLTVSEKRLRTVVIKNKWTYGEVGKYNGYKDCFTSNGYQSQVAKKFTAPFANTFLEAVQIRTTKSQGESMFRLRIYDVDSLTKGPGEELTDTLIQVNAQKGMTLIDMSPYQVWLPRNYFFVAIEWLLIPFNEHRFSAKYEGSKQEFLNYNPCICFTTDPPSVPDEMWGLAYSGKWQRQSQYYSLAISATVKY
jgi:hypothetical protein